MMDALLWLSWAVPVTLLCIVVTLLYLYGTWTHSTWSSQGVNGPKPLPFLGNARDFQKPGIFVCLREWGRQYGKVYGVYLMRMPQLVTTDLDIVKEVFIKDFGNFHQRSATMPFSPYPMNQGLASVNGDQWKRQRHTLTPTFSAHKLKLMGRFITRCCHNLSDAMRKNTQAGKLLDVKQMYGSFTMDVICGTAFGFETNALGNEDNVFLNTAKDLFAEFKPLHLAAIIVGISPLVYLAMAAECKF